MENEVEIKISGIKCDTPHCNYKDDDVKFEDYSNYINKKCPICNSNLLTEEEYKECLKMYKATKIANKILNVLKWFNPFYYIRLIVGDKREMKGFIKEFPKRK